MPLVDTIEKCNREMVLMLGVDCGLLLRRLEIIGYTKVFYHVSLVPECSETFERSFPNPADFKL